MHGVGGVLILFFFFCCYVFLCVCLHVLAFEPHAFVHTLDVCLLAASSVLQTATKRV